MRNKLLLGSTQILTYSRKCGLRPELLLACNENKLARGHEEMVWFEAQVWAHQIMRIVFISGIMVILIFMLLNINIIIHASSDLKARIRADVLNEAGLLLRNSN